MTGTSRITKRLARQAMLLDVAREARDLAVLDAHASGMSQVAIAAAVGLSRGGVQRILDRNGARA